MSSTNPTGSLRAFFEAFETSSARADAARLASICAPTLTVLGPAGTQIVSREDLMRAIPKRQQLFDARRLAAHPAGGARRDRPSTRGAYWPEPNGNGRSHEAPKPSISPFRRASSSIDATPAAPQIVGTLMHHDLTTASAGSWIAGGANGLAAVGRVV